MIQNPFDDNRSNMDKSIGGVTRFDAFDSKSQYATKKPYDTNTQLNYDDEDKPGSGPFDMPIKSKKSPKD
jgi:hypothetical protein